MKKSEYYRNEFSLEELLPELGENEITETINSDGYIRRKNKTRLENGYIGFAAVNIDDAKYYLKCGYDMAKQEIERKLIPIL